MVLSQAGGGFMGIGPMRYLSALEARTGIPNAANRFSLLIGTSIGAVDMALMACGYSARDVLDLHREHGKKIFGTKTWSYTLFKNGPRYDDSYIVKLLKSKLGKLTMDQTATPLYITAYDARKKDIKVFGPKDKGVPIWYAVRCSMAASTYFGPMGGCTITDKGFTILPDGRYVDGGFAANAPLLCGIAAGFEDGLLKPWGLKVMELVTTGKNPESEPIKEDWNILTTLNKVILPSITAGNSSDVGFIASAWLKSLGQHRNQCFRVRPEMPEFDLDNVKESGTVEYIWASQFEKDMDYLLKFLEN